jgi:DNA-binding cell septation regulator SpoVG
MRADNWKLISNGSKARGRADLILDSGMIIRGAMLVAGTNGAFVSLPRQSWTRRDGTKQYSAIIEFEDDARARKFLDAALAALIALAAGSAGERAA